MPKLIGKATASAMIEVASVPQMAIMAPNSSFTGSHSTRVMKPGPNCENAGAAPIASEMMIPISTARTVAANSSVILWKKKSWMRWLRIVVRKAA